jgi:hypothetical protein
MTWVLTAVVVAAIVVALDRLALAAESRGWIYWRRVKPNRGTAANALQHVQAIFEPQIEHVVEERSKIGADQPSEDEPPRTP